MASDCRPTVARYAEPLNWLQVIGTARKAKAAGHHPGQRQPARQRQRAQAQGGHRVAVQPEARAGHVGCGDEREAGEGHGRVAQVVPDHPWKHRQPHRRGRGQPGEPQRRDDQQQRRDQARKPASWSAVDTIAVAITTANHPGAHRRTRLTSRPPSATAAAHGQGRAGLISSYGISVPRVAVRLPATGTRSRAAVPLTARLPRTTITLNVPGQRSWTHGPSAPGRQSAGGGRQMGRERLARYSLAGPENQAAVDAGLAGGNWFRSAVPRPRMKQLMRRSDGPALRDTAIWFGLLLGLAAAVIALWGSWWVRAVRRSRTGSCTARPPTRAGTSPATAPRSGPAGWPRPCTRSRPS